MLAAVVVAVLLPLTAAQPMQESTCASGDYAANSTYQANLNLLAAALPVNVSATPDGYATATVGVVPDQVSALALCRRDVNASSCRACVATGFRGAQRDCPNNKDVTIYQDDCILRFSDQRFLDFVGVNSPVSVLHSDGDILPAPVPVAWFNAAVVALMNATVDLAVAGGNNSTNKYFATAVEDFNPKIYGMAQCAPVMTVAQCRSCLSGFVGSIPWWLNGKPGGRVLGIWCNLRYSVKPFYDGHPMLQLSAPPAPPPAAVPSPAAPQTSTGRKRRIAGISAGVVCFVVLMSILSAWGLIRSERKKATKKDNLLKKMARGKCTIFDLPTLREATENFSEKRKLGEGGFGTVYKGTLPDGQEIAVKKLIESCGNGLHQQYNEVLVLAALQHKNLVRLQGFCVHRNDMLLVYEYMKNGSLENFLFDASRGNTLSWDQQYNIILGIAKGIMYLHEDSSIRIIHRDLKANNILLGEDMDPKIADFGLARLVGEDHTHTKTARIVGTYGYMAPEYAIHGNLSPKIDIFSFGVLVLEIITKRKNCNPDNGTTDTVNLLSYVWSCWTKGVISQVIDQSLEGHSRSEALRCIHIGLLCVQSDPDDRPDIPSVIFMLTRDNMELQSPTQPAFFFGGDSSSASQPSDQRVFVYDRSGAIYEEDKSVNGITLTELGRRVREMREARAAPSVQVLDQKAAAAAARKALTSVQTLPKGVEVLDPLGLGVMDNKSLRLITDSSVSSPVSREKSQGLDPSMRDKVIYSSPNFDPKVFLSWVHKDTSAADLESGALTLKTDLKGRTQQKKQLVKENFDCFVSCKTTIDDIESKLRQIEEDPEGAGTAHLYAVTQKISSVANCAFEPLFERQAQAEKIRSVQGMLQRFRTLFNLPSAIRGNIRKGEYDLAVREYQKAKSIVLPSHVGILKRVLEEVEKVMQEFRGMLYKSMEDPHLDLAELENIVRLLLELEPETDPVWHYLSIQNSRIHGLFEKCTLDHEARMEVLQNKIREKMLSDAKWKQLQQDSNKSLEVDSPIGDSIQADQLSENFMAEEADGLRATYICRLTAVLIQHVPAFWRLALSVFSGKFAKAAAGNMVSDADMNAKPGASKTDDKGEVKYTNHTLDEVSSMVQGTISTFDTKVQNTFRDFEECNILHPYMGDTIKEIAKACQTLEGKDSSPIAVKMLCALHFEITKLYILRLCAWMRTTTKEISKNETWITLSTLERNKSPYAISGMPLEFHDLIISAMDRIDTMILNLRSETAKSFDISQPLQEINESVRLAFLNSFLDFAGYLERFGVELVQNRSNKENNYVQNGYINGTSRETSDIMDGDLHKKLLVVLSNIGYCKAELSDELYTKYRHIWSLVRDNDERSSDMRDLVTSFSALEEKVVEQYTFAKSNLIRSAVQSYLLDSSVHWGAAPTVKGIRDATLDLLHILVAVHAEVYAGARPLLEKAMKILVEALADIFLSVFHENKTKDIRLLDANGFCQLMLELEYFETVLHTYFSPEAQQALKSLQENLLEKACETLAEALENPGHHRQPTRGSEDAASDGQLSSVSPDDLLALAQQYSSHLLQGELERTRLNIACFMESTLQSASAQVGAKPATYASYQAPVSHHAPVQVSSPNFRRQQTGSSSPVVSRRRR